MLQSRTLTMVSKSDSARKRRVMERASKRTIPAEKMSLRWSMVLPMTCSGER